MAATEPPPTAGEAGHVEPGRATEPLSADLASARGPRVSTRALLVLVIAVAALLVASLVASFVILHQARLHPLPVPSVSAIP